MHAKHTNSYWHLAAGMCFLLLSCEYSRVAMDSPIAPVVDTIYSDIGGFGQFEVGSWWDYRSTTVQCNDITLVCDTTLQDYRVEVKRDTVVDGMRYLIIDGSWGFYWSLNGWAFSQDQEHFVRWTSDETDHEVNVTKYLDSGLPLNGMWTDTIEWSTHPAGPDTYTVTVLEISSRTDSTITVTTHDELVTSNQIIGGSPVFRHYRRNVGFTALYEPRVFGSRKIELIDYHVVY